MAMKLKTMNSGKNRELIDFPLPGALNVKVVL
jgi:hypothetical protein